MIPQDRFFIVAPVAEGVIADLRAVLATMTLPGFAGMADPGNATLPFGRFPEIHFGRFVILQDHSLIDRAVYPQLPAGEPTYLCFAVDCDGGADDLFQRIAKICPDLRRVFNFCQDFNASTDLGNWLTLHRVRPAASYVNWLGRSVVQVREEAALHAGLLAALRGATSHGMQDLRLEMLHLVQRNLTKIPPTPWRWRLTDALHFIAPILPLILCLLLAPEVFLAIVVGLTLVILLVLRRREQTDPILPQALDPAWTRTLRQGEDHDVTNQFTAMGSIKPGKVRLGIEKTVLYGINWVARHIFTQGGLGRIGTIHFAHWVFLDGNRRGVFCSNYDGGHEAYMDDFINKAGFGLNLAFSSFIGYPQTDWLLARGAWRERDFKDFQRRHQIPTDVWYKAYPGLTARDMARNARIRNGFEREQMSDDEIRRWLAEI